MVSQKTTPRIIIHGGAGNISRSNLQPEAYQAYRTALLSILQDSYTLLLQPNATALDIATHTVSLLENNPLFNSGHGAVFTRSGTHELEASVMTSTGHRKRGVGVMLVNRVKNPIKLAREMLLRGEEIDGGGAAGHCQLAGETVHRLAEKWGLEMVSPDYYWTKKRWDEHRKGLGLGTDERTYLKKRREAGGGGGVFVEDTEDGGVYAGPDDPSWDGREYLPQGTVGCVVLDGAGTLCAATSTGGLTNKLAGRIGDTPTIGAGFFAEQWDDESWSQRSDMAYRRPARSLDAGYMEGGLGGLLRESILPCLGLHVPNMTKDADMRSRLLGDSTSEKKPKSYPHGVAMSGTGNGDSFLRLSAARTASALVRFSNPQLPLSVAVARVAGAGGMLEESAEDRFGKTGEGEGGIIGIEYIRGEGKIVADMNCGGMFRAWVDDGGEHRVLVFKDE